MKAWIVENNKGINALKFTEQPALSFNNGQLRLSIKACGINNRDIFIAEGKYYRSINLPCILGSDIVGEVTEVGNDVLNFAVGDRVIVYPIIGCGSCEKCLAHRENECSNYDTQLGGLATEIVVEANQCLRLPDYFTYEEAAAIPIAYLTAWNMLFTKAKVTSKETILFWGATSGVGTAGLLLYNQPERSILVVGSEEKENLLRNKGYQKIINYNDKNMDELLAHFTNDEGVDVIFDPVGAAAWDNNFEYLKNNGVHVNCARNTGANVKIDLAKLFSKQISIFGAKTGSKTELAFIMERLIETGNKPIIDKVFNFDEVIEGLDYLKTKKQIGKVVIKVDECRNKA